MGAARQPVGIKPHEPDVLFPSLLLVGESVLVRDRVMLLLIRFVGENEGNDVDLQPLHNGGSPIILRGEVELAGRGAVCCAASGAEEDSRFSWRNVIGGAGTA